MNTYDLSISGSWGLYTIATPTQKGKAWAALHLSEDTGERECDGAGNVICEGGERCRDIVAGAVADGQRRGQRHGHGRLRPTAKTENAVPDQEKETRTQ